MKNILQAMRNGETVIGACCDIHDTAAVQILGLSGWDFVIINCEGGTGSIFGRELERLLLAARAVDVFPVVKVPQNNPAYIASALNQGARLLEIPDVRNAEDGRRAVSAAKFAPLGDRNIGWSVPAMRYGLDTAADYTSRANGESGCYAVLEHAEALGKIDEITAVDGLDVFSIGKVDAELRMGGVGNPEAVKTVTAKRQELAKAARARGKSMLMTVGSPDIAKEAISWGVQMLLWAQDDAIMLANASRNAAADLRAVAG